MKTFLHNNKKFWLWTPTVERKAPFLLQDISHLDRNVQTKQTLDKGIELTDSSMKTPMPHIEQEVAELNSSLPEKNFSDNHTLTPKIDTTKKIYETSDELLQKQSKFQDTCFQTVQREILEDFLPEEQNTTQHGINIPLL